MPRSRPRRNAAIAKRRSAVSIYQVPWPITGTWRLVEPNRWRSIGVPRDLSPSSSRACAISRARYACAISASRAFQRPLLRGFFDSGQQRGEIVTAVVAYTIDKEAGRAVHSAANSTGEILADACRVSMLGHIIAESRHIKIELRGILEQILVFESVLMFVERIVHFPELPLRAGRLRRLRRGRGVRMRVGQREMPKDVPQSFAQPLLDCTY